MLPFLLREPKILVELVSKVQPYLIMKEWKILLNQKVIPSSSNLFIPQEVKLHFSDFSTTILNLTLVNLTLQSWSQIFKKSLICPLMKALIIDPLCNMKGKEVLMHFHKGSNQDSHTMKMQLSNLQILFLNVTNSKSPKQLLILSKMKNLVLII